jgi:hypothetical protein
MLRKFIAAVIMFAFGTAFAQTDGIKFTAFINGKCATAMIASADKAQTCKPTLVNMGYKNGRVSYVFFTTGEAVAFAGGRDRQPSPDYYELDISHVTIDQKRMSAKGKCVMKGDPLATATYTCEARTEVEQPINLRFVFESTGKPQVKRYQN